jgi:acetylglutamate kinase
MGAFRKAAELEATTKAAVLIESLPWLKQFHNQIIVVKFGGNAMVDEALQRAFAEDMAYLHFAGIRPVVVHGGGPQISARLTELGIPSEFRGGYRVTTTESIGVVRDVLSGQISRELAALIDEHQEGLAVTISGEDANLFGGRRRGAVVAGETVDLGLVGDVVAVDPAAIFAAAPRAAFPSSRPSPPTSTRRARPSTSTPTPPHPPSPSPSARRSSSSSPMSPASTVTGPTATRSSRCSTRRSSRHSCPRSNPA